MVIIIIVKESEITVWHGEERAIYNDVKLTRDNNGCYITKRGKLVREFYNVPLDISYEQ